MKDAQIQNIPLFADLNSKERRALGKEFKLEQYRRGETIFAKNSHGDALYLIEEGRISLSTDGKTTLATLGPGSLLGEAEFFQGTPHAMTARAATDVAVSVLDSDSLATLIGNDPYLGIRLSQTLGAPLAHMTGYLAGQLAAIPVMKPLSNNERTLIAEKLVAREYEANQAIYRSSDAATGLYLIQEGVVRLIGESDDDYTELGDGDIFGEMALLSGKPHADTAQTAQTSVIWHLSPSDFVEIAQAQPGIRANLSRTITARLSQADRAYAAEILKQIPLFSQLGPEALADATGYLMLRHVPAGQTIFKAGDHGDAMFIIESGQVELRDDQNRVAARLAEGNYLGELTLMTGKTRIKTAVTTADTNLWGMYRPDFDALLVKHPQLSAALGHALRDRLSAADNQFIEKHLQKLALLGGLSRLQLDEISARLHARRYQTGDTLYQEGQPGQELYFIENGQVERFTSTTSGIVALPSLTSGDFLGE
ncbi:MAG: cyclic nucleotide-binding domain-containing protein, partial [Anaerolineae bacterium]